MNQGKVSNKGTKMKILLADDHQLFREGVRTLLELDPDYQIVSEVDNTDALLADVVKYQPDLVFQDYRMPGGGAITTLNKIKKQFPHIKLIILTGMQSPSLFKQLINSKADGILLKEVSGEFLLQAIKDVINGKRVLSPTVQECLSSEKPQLTSREFQVLELILEGLNNAKIASKLNLSPKTIENHRYNLMQKLGVGSVTELLKYVQDNGYLH